MGTRANITGRERLQVIRRSAVMFVIAAVLSVASFQAKAVDLTGTTWDAAAKTAGVSPYLLYSIALVESSRIARGKAQPHPYAINSPYGSYFPTDIEDATAVLNRLLSNGSTVHPRRVDVGIMQVNVGWNGHRVTQPTDLLNPLVNVQTGAEILAEAMASAPHDLALGIGRYHTWSDETAARRYGNTVLGIYRRLKEK